VMLGRIELKSNFNRNEGILVNALNRTKSSNTASNLKKV